MAEGDRETEKKKLDKHAQREWTKCRVESEFSCSSGYPICYELFMHYISKGILATVTVPSGLTRLDFLASQRKSGHRTWCNPQKEYQVAESTVPTHQKTASQWEKKLATTPFDRSYPIACWVLGSFLLGSLFTPCARVLETKWRCFQHIGSRSSLVHSSVCAR